MDTETSAMVEALYASGRVERPKHSMSEGLLAWAVNRKEWVWDKAGIIFWPAESFDAEVFKSLVQACWAKGWHVWREGQYHVCADGVGGSVTIASDPDPIRVMVDALNGGG